MAQNKLITRSQLDEIRATQTVLAANLVAHANTSLSKAHGMIFYNLPHPYLDGSGNDVSFYADSGGDRVGYYFLRLTYNEVNYYAPLESSTLDGQTPVSTTSITAAATASSAISAPERTPWITDTTSGNIADLLYINNSVLLPHTLLGHWEAHTGGIYQIFPQITLDSAGHIVGNYIARIVLNGIVLEIPCDTRLGGPFQPPRSPTIPVAIFAQSPNNNPPSMNVPIECVTAGGTLPMTFQFQYDSGGGDQFTPTPNGIWVDFDHGPGTQSVPIGLPGWNNNSNDPIEFTWVSTSSNTLTITHTRPNNPNKASVLIRCVVTNAGGSAISNSCAFSTQG